MMIARVISEVCAPWVSNVWFFIVLGCISGDIKSGVIAAVGTGVIPMVLILWLMLRGVVGDHHVTQRGQRAVVIAGIVVCVVALTIFLKATHAASLVYFGVVSALVFLAAFAAVTIVASVKASFHVGLWVCISLYLSAVSTLWWSILLLAVPAIGWARVAIRHHTMVEIVTGAVVGALVATACSVQYV